MLIALIVLLPFLYGVGAYIIGKKNENGRDIFVIVAAAVEFLMVIGLWLTSPVLDIDGVFSSGLHFTTDGFRTVYAMITAVMWLFTTVFSKEYFQEEREHLNRYWLYVMITLGATEGVMLSADLMTTFIFFEIVSFASFTWVMHEETAEAIRAGNTYLYVSIFGGMLLFIGVLLLQHSAGTLLYGELAEVVKTAGLQGELLAAGICILLGFGAKAGMFPLHIWLPKAHPVAPSPASALLSGILTKVGVYGIMMIALNVFLDEKWFGMLVLVLGTITMVLGAVLALFSVNLKRTLACSSMSQIGFILIGVAMAVLLSAYGAGEEAMVAESGLMMHMVNHSLFKLCLFMAAGVVLMKVHSLDLNVIRGWGRNKIFLKIAFALGGLGISGMPLFSGYLSKTLLHEGITAGIEYCGDIAGLLHVVEWIFLISGGMTFAYMLKLFICIFVEKNSDEKKQKLYDSSTKCMNGASTAAVFDSSLFMVILGQPFVIRALLRFMTGSEWIDEFAPFSFESLQGGLISLGIGAIIYWFFIRKVLIKEQKYLNRWPVKLDLENAVYRPLVVKILPAIGEMIARPLGDLLDAVIVLVRKTFMKEMKVRKIEGMKPNRLEVLQTEIKETTGPAIQNFSFALMMTCIGIVLVLGVLVAYLIF